MRGREWEGSWSGVGGGVRWSGNEEVRGGRGGKGRLVIDDCRPHFWCG